MKTLKQTRLKLSAVVLAIFHSTALASSAIGTDNHLGNELNPTGQAVLCQKDPQGLSAFSQESRSPTGFLYDKPCLSPNMDTEGDGWIVFGSVEAGVVGSGGDDDNIYFVEYVDRDTTPTITVLSVSAQDKSSARYAQFNAGNLGRDDMHIEVGYGKAGSYKARLTYNKLPHAYATNAKSIYKGVGTGNLTLPEGTPVNSVFGAEGTAALNDEIASKDNLILHVDRERFGISGEYELFENVKAFVDYKHEKRDGIKAYGGSFNFDFIGVGGVNEVVQPIDYISDDITLGAYYTGGNINLNLSYTGSFFKNDIDSLTYENPWITAFDNYQPKTGQTDLAPENDFNQFRLEANYRLPWWKGLMTLTVSRGRMEQDDQLLPFTSNSGILDFDGFTIDMADWNTTAALERDSADTQIDTALEQLKLSFKPTSQISVKLGYRRYEEDNESASFDTCNAITGQCAFVFLDGAISTLFGSPGLFRLYDPDNGFFTNFHQKSIPFDYNKDNYSAGATYSFTSKTKLSLNYDLEMIERSYREVKKTLEDKFQVNLVHRDADWGTLRLEAGYADRDFDGEYNPNPYEHFYTEELLHEYIDVLGISPEQAAEAQAAFDNLAPHTLAELRKSDISARQQMTLAMKLNVAIGTRTDLMITGDYKENDYDALYGIDEEKTTDVGFELSHMQGANTSGHMSYHYQTIESSMNNIDSVESGTDAFAGGSYYPLENAWSSSEDESSHFVSLGVNTQIAETIQMGFNYSYGITETDISYSAASSSALAGSLQGVDASPNGSFDPLKYEQQIIELQLRQQLTGQLSWRLFASYEIGSIDDFHYDGIQYAESSKMMLGTFLDDWNAYTYGVLAQYNF